MAERIFKPAPAHNRLMGPAVCLCVDCCRLMDAKRCDAIDSEGRRCGDYKRHGGRWHTQLVPTVFAIVDERLRLDADPAPLPERNP